METSPGPGSATASYLGDLAGSLGPKSGHATLVSNEGERMFVKPNVLEMFGGSDWKT